MHSSLLSAYLLASCLPFLADATPVLSCKPIPGDPDWPSEGAWAELNATVSGRLVRPVPLGAVCQQGQYFDASQCSAVQAAWTDWHLHTEDLVSMGKPNWSNDTCVPFEGFPCSRVA